MHIQKHAEITTKLMHSLFMEIDKAATMADLKPDAPISKYASKIESAYKDLADHLFGDNSE